MTKIGLLVECGRDGLEIIVCRKIHSLMVQEHGIPFGIEILPMDNKDRLLSDCGTAAANLLRDGCERVVVLWDERPPQPVMGDPLCWHNERVRILNEMQTAKVEAAKVHLVCIEREFESWLLFDHKMLERVLSRPTHPVTVPKQKRPDRHANPKGAMTTLVRKLAGQTYVDVQFAGRFADALHSLNRLRKCATFKRFEAGFLGME